MIKNNENRTYHWEGEGEMKKKKKQKIVYHEPPMKYNIALHKFEPNLPTVEKGTAKIQVPVNKLLILIIILIILFGVILYKFSQIY